ncbi:MAG: transporter substrate-binding protein [Candidatus Manganitrophus sp.]|nr:transporter substrate-binding protein [Candidatus Manganitrophus sp.]
MQYEGGRVSRKIVFYTGAAPNQQAIPAVEYLMSEDGRREEELGAARHRLCLPAHHQQDSARVFLKSKGVAEADIMEELHPVRPPATIRPSSPRSSDSAPAGKRRRGVDTINGDSNVPFYKELANTRVKAEDIPVVAFSVGEEELRGIDTKPLVGHLAAWNYFQSVNTPENKELVKKFKDFAKKNNLPGGASRVVDDPMFWGYNGLYLWKAAVEKAGSTDVDAVLKAYPGLEVQTAAGKIVADTRNHHTAKPVYIGRILANGQFEIIWQSKGLVTPEPWSEYTYPDRQCDWGKGGKGSFDMKGGQKVFLDPAAMPIEPM